jgi:hypothetical protein
MNNMNAPIRSLSSLRLRVAIATFYLAIVPAMLADSTCPLCQPLNSWSLNSAYYVTYTNRRECQGSGSASECLTSPSYTANYTYTIHIQNPDGTWSTQGPYSGTYTPCYTDDTMCGGNG